MILKQMILTKLNQVGLVSFYYEPGKVTLFLLIYFITIILYSIIFSFDHYLHNKTSLKSFLKLKNYSSKSDRIYVYDFSPKIYHYKKDYKN